jgi:hypothetical protein
MSNAFSCRQCNFDLCPLCYSPQSVSTNNSNKSTADVKFSDLVVNKPISLKQAPELKLVLESTDFRSCLGDVKLSDYLLFAGQTVTIVGNSRVSLMFLLAFFEYSP